MNFLVDAQLPPALARWIADRGHPAVHVAKLGMEAVDDGIIWDYARKNQAVIISKDEDFADRWLLNNEGGGVGVDSQGQLFQRSFSSLV